MHATRRSVLRSGAMALPVASIAGCLSDPTEDEGSETVYAAFFPLWDWTKRVVGDRFTVENAVDVGELGHGWEPPAQLRQEIADSAAFVYLDTDEFSWAQTVASDLETDYPSVTRIDVMAGLEDHLLPVDGESEADEHRAAADQFDGSPDSVTVGDLSLYDRRTGTEVAYLHGDHWHGGVPDVPLSGSIEIEVVFEDESGHILPLGDDEPFHVDASVVNGNGEEIVEIESGGEYVVLSGSAEGLTRIVFELVADGDVVWDSSVEPSTVSVVETVESGDSPEFYDPHVWTDPVLAQDMVETIAEGFAAVDEETADVFEANAAEYVEELSVIDRAFEDLAATATRDVAVFAGHDSFQYLEHRYDFTIRTPVGVSPDEAESSEDVAELIATVEEYDIDTVLYDPFETTDLDEEVPAMVEILLESTEATDYAPLTPVEGTTEDWKDRGWGWVEQMTEVNLPSLEAALGVED